MVKMNIRRKTAVPVSEAAHQHEHLSLMNFSDQQGQIAPDKSKY